MKQVPPPPHTRGVDKISNFLEEAASSRDLRLASTEWDEPQLTNALRAALNLHVCYYFPLLKTR